MHARPAAVQTVVQDDDEDTLHHTLYRYAVLFGLYGLRFDAESAEHDGEELDDEDEEDEEDEEQTGRGRRRRGRSTTSKPKPKPKRKTKAKAAAAAKAKAETDPLECRWSEEITSSPVWRALLHCLGQAQPQEQEDEAEEEAEEETP